MKGIYHIISILTYWLLFSITQNLQAQPVNDECVNAIDISDAFTGICGDFSFNGPFTTSGSTPNADDPPEPGNLSVCPGEEDENLFADDATAWENSIWFKWTVPDLNGDGSPVKYSIWTSDGSFDDDCGLRPIVDLPDVLDTQTAIYEDNCPNASTGLCDHFAANEDLLPFPETPWISGWLSLEFTPGVTYYMGVDNWDGYLDQGEFCITVVVCGLEGDGICFNANCDIDYCDCEECRVGRQGNLPCPFGDIAPLRYDREEDLYYYSNDLSGNIFFCSEFVKGYSNDENIYLGFGVIPWTDCNNNSGDSLDVELSVGTFANTSFAFIPRDLDNGDFRLRTVALNFIELIPSDLAAGSITITGTSVPDGLGNQCQNTLTLNFADYPQTSNPYCELTCFAGGIDTDLLGRQLTVYDKSSFNVSTNGLEDLTLPCASDDGSGYIYSWRLWSNPFSDFIPFTSWKPLGSNPTINAETFFVDEFGQMPPYFLAGSQITIQNYYIENPISFKIEGAAVCYNSNGDIVDICFASNEGYENSLIDIEYLPGEALDCEIDIYFIDCQSTCDGTLAAGTSCETSTGLLGKYDENCNCIPNPPAVGSFNCDN